MRMVLVFGLPAVLSLSACHEKGCTDEVADNFNPSATYENGTCRYSFGCTDSNSFNFDPKAGIDDGSCQNFNHWESWVLVHTTQGVDTTDTILGVAHAGDDTLAVRKTFVRNDQQAVDSLYPVGTMIVRHIYSLGDSLQTYAAMLKQASGFNPASGDWEWFMLNADGSVAKDNKGKPLRGGNLMDNYCTDCHAKAAVDFVFLKQ